MKAFGMMWCPVNAEIPLLEEVGLAPVGGFCRSLIKKPEGVELTPCGGFPAILQGQLVD